MRGFKWGKYLCKYVSRETRMAKGLTSSYHICFIKKDFLITFSFDSWQLWYPIRRMFIIVPHLKDLKNMPIRVCNFNQKFGLTQPGLGFFRFFRVKALKLHQLSGWVGLGSKPLGFFNSGYWRKINSGFFWLKTQKKNQTEQGWPINPMILLDANSIGWWICEIASHFIYNCAIR